MAAGMIIMYAVPQASHTNLYWGGVGLYAAFTVAMATVGARWWRSERLLNWLWTASTVDLAVMTYMALPAANRTATISYLAVAYLAVEMVIWLSGPALSLPRAAVDGMASRARPPGSAAPPEEGKSACLVADVTIDLRVAMAVMSASMVWMLIAMQNMQPVVGGTMMLLVPVSARVCRRLRFRR